MRTNQRTTLLAMAALVGTFVACGSNGSDGTSSDDAGATPSSEAGSGTDDASGGDAGELQGDAGVGNDSGGTAVDAANGDGAVEAGDDAGDAADDGAADASVDAGTRTVTLSFFDPTGRLLGEYDELGAPKYEVAYLGATPIAATYGDATYAIHADQLGTPRALVDATGMTAWKWDGDAFGATAPDEDVDGDGVALTFGLRFPGQLADPETGLVQNYFRDYDPSAGRYLQVDPLGAVGGPNVYAYVSGNPLSLLDRFGLAGEHVTINAMSNFFRIGGAASANDISGADNFSFNRPENLAELVNMVGQYSGGEPVTQLDIYAHGNVSQINIGTSNQVIDPWRFDDGVRAELARLRSMLGPNAVVVLHSCITGKAGPQKDLLRMLAEALNATVVAGEDYQYPTLGPAIRSPRVCNPVVGCVGESY